MLFTSSSWRVIDQCQTKWNKKQKHTKANFSGLVWTKGNEQQVWLHPRCSNGKKAPGVVHPALCSSHGNKTLQPQEVSHTGIPGSRAVRSHSHSGVVHEVAGEKRNTRAHRHRHTRVHSNSQKSISVTPHPALLSHHSVLDSRAPFLLPGSHLCVLPGLNWYSQGLGWVARAQTGRWEPEFQGMQLISIKIPPLGVIRNELGWGETQSIPAAGRGVSRTLRPGIICLTNEDVILIRMQTEIIQHPGNIFPFILISNIWPGHSFK